MTTKLAILLTVAVIGLVFSFGCGAVFFSLDPTLSRDLERADLIGRELEWMLWVPLAFIWFLWALRAGHQPTAHKR